MVIVLINNPQAPPAQQNAIHIENGSPQQALATLQNAINMISQQLAGPKVFLPNGQAHVVPLEQQQPPNQGQ